jgi:hypothetical protein
VQRKRFIRILEGGWLWLPSIARRAHRGRVLVGLFERGPELGGSALCRAVGEVEDYSLGSAASQANDRRLETEHTLLNAVLLGFALSLGRGDALDALIKVVLGRRALLGIPAVCLSNVPRQPRSIRITQRRVVAVM